MPMYDDRDEAALQKQNERATARLLELLQKHHRAGFSPHTTSDLARRINATREHA